MPYTPAGIFLVDQWRQIGVTAEHKQFDTAPYLAAMNAGNYDVAIDFSNLFMDEPSLGLAKYLSLNRAPENRSRAIDPELDKLYDAQVRELDSNKRKAMIQAFEKRLFEQAYQQPMLWWHRIVPTHKMVMGWKMSPSHNLGQQSRRRVAEPVMRRCIPTLSSSSRSPALREVASARSRLCGEAFVPPTRRIAVRSRLRKGSHRHLSPHGGGEPRVRRERTRDREMLRYTLHRLLLMIPTLIGVAVLVFFMLRIVPGDVVEVKLRGDGGTVSQETIDMRAQAARSRQAADEPVRRLDDRARDASISASRCGPSGR